MSKCYSVYDDVLKNRKRNLKLNALTFQILERFAEKIEKSNGEAADLILSSATKHILPTLDLHNSSMYCGYDDCNDGVRVSLTSIAEISKVALLNKGYGCEIGSLASLLIEKELERALTEREFKELCESKFVIRIRKNPALEVSVTNQIYEYILNCSITAGMSVMDFASTVVRLYSDLLIYDEYEPDVIEGTENKSIKILVKDYQKLLSLTKSKKKTIEELTSILFKVCMSGRLIIK